MSNQASAIIVADSISEAGVRLTTFQLRYWRPIHSELMTHRVFSRNAGSSRARPSAKIIEQVRRNPWGPIHWGVNQAGMQAHTELGEQELMQAKSNWHLAARWAADAAQVMLDINVHKQIVNRLLEPFTYIDVLVTATDFANWFALRDHPAAQPEIQELAKLMKQAYQESLPTLLHGGQWHLPYITEEDWKNAYWKCKEGRITRDEPSYKEKLAVVLKISVARCARVSYKAFDGNVAPIEKDLELYDQLLGSQPVHASPAEHQATPDEIIEVERGDIISERYANYELHGNFRGWIQYRKTLPNEYVPG